jgi:hypothetical protein
MVNTNAVAVVMVEANKLIDKLELETGVFGKEDLKFLAKYQAKLASARTRQSDDMYFCGLFMKWMAVKSMKT